MLIHLIMLYNADPNWWSQLGSEVQSAVRNGVQVRQQSNESHVEQIKLTKSY